MILALLVAYCTGLVFGIVVVAVLGSNARAEAVASAFQAGVEKGRALEARQLRAVSNN